MKSILVSSTRQWNPGDEFIFFGVRRLLTHQLGDRINWVLWNRNPDLFMNRWKDSHFRPDLLTNSLQVPDLDVVNAVVLAGTPEWKGDSVEPLYRELLRRPEIPVLLCGIGSGAPGLNLRPYEKSILNRDNTLITTRSVGLAEEINQILGQKKAIALPCPALFAAPRGFTPKTQGKIGLIVQSSRVENQRVDRKAVDEILSQFHDSTEVELITLYIDELRFYSHEGFTPRYSYDAADYIRPNGILSDYRYIISSRLHGALGALSLGIPTSLVPNGSHRVNTAGQLCRQVMPLGSFTEEFARAQAMEYSGLVERHSDAVRFREKIWASYDTILKPFVSSHLWMT